jgi:ABC-2 type transport system permease protein
VSLVLLEFAGAWGLPLVAGVVAGDLFAAEDRHGTWKTILTRSRSRDALFVAKVFAAATTTVALGLLLMISSTVAGALLAGAHPLTNLGGTPISAAHALALTVLSWLVALLPTLAYTSIAVLFSVLSRNGIVGVLSPLLVSLATQLLDLIGNGVTVHLLLPGSGFDGWHGLFGRPPFYGPLLVSILVDLGWIALALALSWRLLAGRDFAATTVTARTNGWFVALRVVVIATTTIIVLALACSIGPTGDTQARVRESVTQAFRTLTVRQQSLLGHPIPPTARISILPNCNRHATASVGPGDWSCTMNVYIIERHHLPLTLTPVEYDVSVAYNGCYKAASPPTFIGGQTIIDHATGRSIPNPLYIFYGCFNVL